MKLKMICSVLILLLAIDNICVSQCQWHVQRGPDPRVYPAICFVDSLHGWVGRSPAATDCMLRTTNGGKTWDTINFSVDIGTVSSISFIDTLRGWCMVPSLNKLLKTTDGGVTWIEIYTTPYYKLNFIIQFVDSLHGFGVGPDTAFNVTRVWRSIDGGMSWVSQIIPNGSLGRIKFIDACHGWLIGQGIYVTTDSGLTWKEQLYDSVTVGGLFGVDFLDSLRGWACATSSEWVIHTTDGGRIWTNQFQMNQPNGMTLRGISFADSLNGWVFGTTFYQGDLAEVIYKTSDGGDIWYQESIGLSRGLDIGVAVDHCHVWAVGSGDGSILELGTTTDVIEPTLNLPETIKLSDNYPNPFNPSTTILLQLPHREYVVLKIIDVTGREVQTLIDDVKEPGIYTLQFDASGFSSGVYSFHLITPTSHQVKKSLLIK